ncbi:MAG: nuclear transport factor 2 family protein [Bryobacteraceae bacterium]|jgi:ketosteroid isomerase-like protein
MKRLMATLLMMALSAGMALAQAQTKAADAKKPAASGNAAADELKQIENDWNDAVKTRNADKLGDILADGWVGLDWDGKTFDKAKRLAELKSPGNSLDTIEMGPMKVRIFGNTAVVTGSDTEKSMENGKDTSGKYVWTDVFVKQNGKWRVVASQSTKVPK